MLDYQKVQVQKRAKIMLVRTRNSTIQWQLQDPKLEVPIPYIRPIVQAYVSEYPSKIWPKIWYGRTSINWILEFPLNDADHVSEKPISKFLMATVDQLMDPMDFASNPAKPSGGFHHHLF